MFPEKTRFGRNKKKRKCLIIKHLRFQTSQKSEIYSHSRAPCAAARRAIGTRNGEQDA